MQNLSVALRHVSMSPGPRNDEVIFRPDIDDIVNPAPFVSMISFSSFRTQGLRRTVGEGSQVRFVTSDRVLRLLRATRCRTEDNEAEDTQDVSRQGKLRAVGFSEYMDSAISQQVLEELLFRGGVICHYEVEDGYTPAKEEEEEEEEQGRGRHRARDRHPPIKGRHHNNHNRVPASIAERSDPAASNAGTVQTKYAESTHLEKRLQSNLQGETPVVALDFCACTSRFFADAMGALIDQHSYIYTEPLVALESGGPGDRLFYTTYPHLKRLGLFNVTITPETIGGFVLRFTSLTHLDLTSTRAGPILLQMLQMNGLKGMRLKALSLSKCRNLSEEALLRFFCGPKATLASDQAGGGWREGWHEPLVVSELTELSLAGDPTQPSPITLEGAHQLVLQSVPFTKGLFVSLDLSSVELNDQILSVMAPQPDLVQLGLGSCLSITLGGLSSFLLEKAPGVEVLDLAGSCESSRSTLRPGQRSLPPLSITDLHTNLIDVIARPTPFFASSSSSSSPSPSNLLLLDGRKTALRVIELDEATLNAIQGGAIGWKVTWGKGQRGW